MENTSLQQVVAIVKAILTVAADKLVKLWDSRSGEFVQNFEGHTKGISDIAWSASSELLASGSDDKTVRLWNVNTVET